MAKKYPIQPVVPAYGVTPDFTQEPIIFSVIDDGSRGWPWAVIFVPCKEVNGKAQIVLDSSINPQDKRGELFTTAYWMPQEETMTPYRLEVASEHWPTHGEFVVLLLLPFQSKGVGSEPFFPLTLPWRRVPPDEYFKSVTTAVNDYFSETTLSELALGRIAQGKLPLPQATPIAPGQSKKDQSATAPANPQPNQLVFALVSCQYPSDILDQMPTDTPATVGPADASLLALGRRLKQKDAPTLLLLMGDQVYVDATAGMFDPKVLDDKYRWPYQRRGASPGQVAIRPSGLLAAYSLIDDHEIDDNWDAGALTKPGEKSSIDLGKTAYWEFQRGLKHGTNPPAACWRAVSHAGFPFFLSDTRTERETRTVANTPSRKIMEDSQFEALKTWLQAQDATKPKFIATSSALLPRNLSVARDPATALHSDAWDAYPHSMYELLAYICDQEIKCLVFLSGDQHISNLVEASVSNIKTGKICKFHSVHSSALYAPYPFANAIPEDFARCETFGFPLANTPEYRCTVASTFAPPGDGFAVLSVNSSSAGGGSTSWHLKVTFLDASGSKFDQPNSLKLI